jgi:hypothetical protein
MNQVRSRGISDGTKGWSDRQTDRQRDMDAEYVVCALHKPMVNREKWNGRKIPLLKLVQNVFVRVNVLSSTDGFNETSEFLQEVHYLVKKIPEAVSGAKLNVGFIW